MSLWSFSGEESVWCPLDFVYSKASWCGQSRAYHNFFPSIIPEGQLLYAASKGTCLDTRLPLSTCCSSCWNLGRFLEEKSLQSKRSRQQRHFSALGWSWRTVHTIKTTVSFCSHFVISRLLPLFSRDFRLNWSLKNRAKHRLKEIYQCSELPWANFLQPKNIC